MVSLHWIDYAVMATYFVFVLGIGAALKGRMRSSGDFLLSGRSIPAWVAGLAFISANLGAQEVVGMGASGAKYGIITSHFYWVGAIPAMLFVGLFMMPFYYGS
ncbi:MAG: sodium:solute symporter family transporter, partial [Gemmatimonadales bacterium]